MPNVHTNGDSSWFSLTDQNIYGGINNFQYTTKFSSTIDALIKANCTVNQIYIFFQSIGINVYEDHINLYLKRGINNSKLNH